MRYDYDVDDKIKIMIWKTVLFIIILIFTSLVYSSFKPKDPKVRDDKIIAASELLCVYDEKLKISNKRFDECMLKKAKIDDDTVIECKKYGNSIAELPFSNVDGTISSSISDDINEAISISKQTLMSGKQYQSSCSSSNISKIEHNSEPSTKSIENEITVAQ